MNWITNGKPGTNNHSTTGTIIAQVKGEGGIMRPPALSDIVDIS